MASKRKAEHRSPSPSSPPPSQKRRTEDDEDDFSGFPYVPETPPTPDPNKKTPSRYSQETNRSASQMDALIERLFRDGIAHRSQWDQMPAYDQYTLRPDEREYVLGALRERFGNSRSLYAQLPYEEPESLRLAFYNPEENWFHQLLEKEGYDAALCALTIKRWLNGEINTLILCGGRLANAKLLYNVLASCFPMAISDSDLNDIERIANVAQHTSLYCVPFVDRAPSTLALHFMEGNSGTCYIAGRPVFVRAPQMLIHCTDVSIACSFLCRNSTILFLTAPQELTPVCHNPRRELKDFVASTSRTVPCAAVMHCKRENRLCQTCAGYSPEY
ncbi:ORF13 protein [Fowl aviadenovirus D]|uniref:ORF13 n=1 Tax=Fowl aviadenovirus D TaxID=190064 RepID=A0A1D6X918_9ADEN|nr:ORF13 [Fowl aviadenovirus D]QIM09470.1 ORF13 [Fowl adenovirus]AKR76186.1 ORF13 protein [Fowl aviadenovirus D]AOE47745.1 ORF13 [Fowl aviadenovirus D]ATG30757.1 ORF13 [Fowl aviadenovirus D]UYD40935.1 hypothetical protein [Fowl aviadenovirus D]